VNTDYHLLNSEKPLTSTINERASMLDKTRWASVFSYRDLQILASYLSAYKVPKGTVLLQEGARELNLYVLVSGKVDVYKKASSQQDQLIAHVSAGMTLGEMALIDGQPRSATALTAEEVLVLVMSKEEFLRLTEDNPRVALKLYGYVASLLSQRLRQVSAKLADYLHDEGYLV
jgi:CRP-like cAMP-binding protein